MKKTYIKVFTLLYFTLLFDSCVYSYVQRNINVGNAIVRKIEKYRLENDSLPNTLQEICQNEKTDGILFCYCKIDSVNYMLWFGTTLGEGIYYYSDKNEWENKLRKIEKQ